MRKLLSHFAFWMWAVLVFNTILILLIADLPITTQNLMWMIVALIWLLLSHGIIPIALVILYRRCLSGWIIWVVLISLFGLGAFAGQVGADMLGARLALLGSMTLMSSTVALMSAILILMFQYDLGLRFAAWATGISIWAATLIWSRQGNIIEAMLQSLEQPGVKPAAGTWWLSLLLTGTFCLVPLALLSFVWHTIVLLKREFKGEFPVKTK